MKFQKEFERALNVHRQGKLREAFLRYDAIVKADPRHAPALHYSGVVLHQAGQREAAAQRIRAAIEVDPSSAEAWSNLGLVLEAVGRQEAAINALKEAVRRDPRAADIAANLAAMLMANHQLDDAEAAARHATSADPQYPQGWYNLALVLEARNRTLEALNAASRAASLAPGQTEFAGLKAQLERDVAAPDRARATLEAALARNPTSAPLRFEYASVLENAGEPQAAAHAYQQALRLDPSHAPALSQLIFLKRWLADWNELPALETQFGNGVARGQPLLSPFVLLGQPSTRDEQRRCAGPTRAA